MATKKKTSGKSGKSVAGRYALNDPTLQGIRSLLQGAQTDLIAPRLAAREGWSVDSLRTIKISDAEVSEICADSAIDPTKPFSAKQWTKALNIYQAMLMLRYMTELGLVETEIEKGQLRYRLTEAGKHDRVANAVAAH